MEKREREELIKELNDLSEFEEQNKERMREIASVLVAEYMPEKKVDDYEFKHLKICRKWIQRQSCRWCIWEAACHLEEQNMVG